MGETRGAQHQRIEQAVPPRRGDRQRPARRPDTHAQVKFALPRGQPLTRDCRAHRDKAGPVIYYLYKSDQARRTLRGIDEQVNKAEQAVAARRR